MKERKVFIVKVLVSGAQANPTERGLIRIRRGLLQLIRRTPTALATTIMLQAIARPIRILHNGPTRQLENWETLDKVPSRVLQTIERLSIRPRFSKPPIKPLHWGR